MRPYSDLPDNDNFTQETFIDQRLPSTPRRLPPPSSSSLPALPDTAFHTPYSPRYYDIPDTSRPGSATTTPSPRKVNLPSVRALPTPPAFPDLTRTRSGSFSVHTDSSARSSLRSPTLRSQNWDDTESNYDHQDVFGTQHFGDAPEKAVPRRNRNIAKKQVRLTAGNLVLDCPIPSKLSTFLPRKDSEEFTHMRYTAITCEPDEYLKGGYTLRQSIYDRETQLFIVITMYNEDEILFTRTMHGVMRNVAHLCSRSKSRVWGKQGWKKIVVCIVADGRRKVHPRVLDVLAAMGVYQDGIAKNLVNGREVKAHLYEYTTQVSLDPDMKFKGAERGIVPVQVMFCLKEKNAKKLNSHRWFFKAFSPVLKPNVCVLLDVGTRPGERSIYHLWKAFDNNSNVAGACGEIKAMKGKAWTGLLNPLIASQNFEYKMSNILDKPFESVFGYISVLPGAFSAYRYIALQNDITGRGPLDSYFKGETLHGSNADIFTSNMYLAEDRILCWELVAKRDEKWVLKYVPAAQGETDVPDAVAEFVSQRRRWLNGAFFAAVYALSHFKQIWHTDHSIMRKIGLHIEFFYQLWGLIFNFVSLANFYLAFYFAGSSIADMDPLGHGWGARTFILLKYVCVLLTAAQFILSMGNRPQGTRSMFITSMVVYGCIMIYTIFCATYLMIYSFKQAIIHNNIHFGNSPFTDMLFSASSTYGIYFFMSLLYLDPWHMISSFPQYIILLPSYVCTLQIYAFCNTHDVSWGTKGDTSIHTDLGAAVVKGDIVEIEMPFEQHDIDTAYNEALANLRERKKLDVTPPNEGQVQEDYYREIRTRLVLIWLIANGILAMAVTDLFDHGFRGSIVYLKVTIWMVAALAFFRALGSLAFLLLNFVQRIGRSKYVQPNLPPFRRPKFTELKLEKFTEKA